MQNCNIFWIDWDCVLIVCMHLTMGGNAGKFGLICHHFDIASEGKKTKLKILLSAIVRIYVKGDMALTT
jgi:hypothetical protein